MNYIVLRNNQQFIVSPEDLKNNDFVLAQNGCFYPASNFSVLQGNFCQPTPNLSDILLGIGGVVLFTVGVFGILDAIESFLQPEYNNKPLTQGTRNYIRERDEEICAYCGIFDPSGHVDHRISRFNGGSNDYDNLTWACVFCNCSKGSLNDSEFIQYM